MLVCSWRRSRGTSTLLTSTTVNRKSVPSDRWLTTRLITSLYTVVTYFTDCNRAMSLLQKNEIRTFALNLRTHTAERLDVSFICSFPTTKLPKLHRQWRQTTAYFTYLHIYYSVVSTCRLKSVYVSCHRIRRFFVTAENSLVSCHKMKSAARVCLAHYRHFHYDFDNFP